MISLFLVFLFASETKNSQNFRVKSIKTDGYSFIITHSPTKLNISSLFSLRAKLRLTEVFFPVGTATQHAINDNTTKITFIFPFLGIYKAKLRCEILNLTFNATLAVRRYSETNYTQMHCHYSFFETRWCEGHNLAYINGSFKIFSQAEFSLPSPFVAPSARAPPFDDKKQRITLKVVNTLNNSLEVREGESFIYGTFFNMFMLWHSIFDFAVPFLTFIGFYKPIPRENRTIYIQNTNRVSFPEYCKCMGDIRRLEKEGDFIMKKFTLGIEKFEEYPYIDRHYDDSISFKYMYNFTDNTGELRNGTLLLNKISPLGFGIKNKPLVIFIDRNTTKRNITNFNDVYNIVKDTFSYCTVMKLDLEKIPPKEQLYYFSRSSVVFGVHGSGLTNVVWMKDSKRRQRTHLVEILPLKYNCRNWFKVASEFAGVEYHSIESNQTILLDSEETKRCRENSDTECARLKCHDLLRDQDITVPIPKFIKLANEIAESIKETETFNEFALELYKKQK